MLYVRYEEGVRSTFKCISCTLYIPCICSIVAYNGNGRTYEDDLFHIPHMHSTGGLSADIHGPHVFRNSVKTEYRYIERVKVFKLIK